MKLNTRWLTVVAIVVLAFVFLAIGLRKRTVNWTSSSFDSSPFGLKALYLLLKAKNERVLRWRRNLTNLTDDVQVLLIADPSVIPIAKEESKYLLHWIRSGGDLVFLPGYGARFFRSHLARDLNLKLNRKPRQRFFDEVNDLSVAEWRSGWWEKYTLTALGKPNSSCVPKEGLNVRADYALEDPKSFYEPIVSLRGKMVYGARKIGRGRVFFIGDPIVFSNFGLRKKEHAAFSLCLLGALARNRSGAIAFDEYHHGHLTEGRLSAYAKAPSAKSLFAQALLIAVLGIWSLAPRFGHAIFRPEERERRTTEFVESIGELYQRSAQKRACSELAADDLRRRLCALAGKPKNARFSELNDWLHQRFGRRDLVETIDHHLRVTARQAKYSKESFLAFQRLIHHIKSRV